MNHKPLFAILAALALGLMFLLATAVTGASSSKPRTSPVAVRTLNALAIPTASVPPNCQGKPIAAYLVSPDNGAELSDPQVKLDWAAAACATKYKVIVRRDASNGPRVERKKTKDTGYITTTLPLEHKYYWNVKACNSYGCVLTSWQMFELVLAGKSK